MRLDYEDLTECVDKLIGTRRSVEEVAAEVASIEAGKIENLHTVEQAAPACVSCGVRGYGSEMVDNPRGGKEHRMCV